MIKRYESSDVVSLSDYQHVRLRPNIYFGSNELTDFLLPDFTDGLKVKTQSLSSAALRAYFEVVDNSIDEFSQLPDSYSKKLIMEYSPTTGKMCIMDNGRGVPIDDHKTGKPTPEVVFTTLRSGRNFEDDKKEIGVCGQNGVGSSCTAYTSSFFAVEIHREGKKYTQKYSTSKDALVISEPKIISTASDKTGTSVTFQLDPKVFKNNHLIPEPVIHNKAIEIAMCNPGVAVTYVNSDTNEHENYKFKKFTDGFVKLNEMTKYASFEFKTKEAAIEAYVFFDQENPVNVTWVNGSLVLLGGLAETQFRNAFVAKTLDELQSEAQKTKTKILSKDIEEGLSVFVNVRVRNPSYDSQAKTRMVGPSLRDEFREAIDDGWKALKRNYGPWLESVLERASSRSSYDQARKNKKDLKKKVTAENLLDATSTNRLACQIILTEGISANASIKHVRDPEFMAAYPLTGKINNIYGMKPHAVATLPKVAELLRVCGLVPGHKADPDLLRYGRVIAATDSDFDGSDILCLLVNLFYQFWPELFDKKNPRIYRMTAPNVCVVKGDQRIHFTSQAEFDKVKDKYAKGYEIKYYKGLGSLSMQDWILTFNNPKCFIPIIDDGNLAATLALLFSDNVAARKQWLTNEI